MTLGRRRPGSPGCSPRVRLPWPKPRKDDLRDLCLSFRALVETLEPPCVGSSSRGIGVPAADVAPARPLRGAEAPVGPAPPGAGSCSALVVSHHYDGLLRVEVAGLLHPATGRGFTAFRACRLEVARRRPAAGIRSRGAFRTLRRVPLVSSRTRITAAVAFLSFCPARRGGPAETGDRADRDPRRSGGRTPEGPAWGAGRAGLRRAPSPGVPGDGRWGSEEPRRPGRTRLRGAVEAAVSPRRTDAPESDGSLPRGEGGSAVPGGEAPAPRSRVPNPGGSGRAGLRRTPSPNPGDGRWGSEEPRRPGRARLRRAGEAAGPDGEGPMLRRAPGAHLDGGVRSVGLRGVPAEPGRVTGAPKSLDGVPGMTGVRTRRLGTGCEEEVPMR
jgi:hypothetical protein